jgi:hypothetical protein
LIQSLDALGSSLEAVLVHIEGLTARSPVRARLLGLLLGLAAIGGGLLAFVSLLAVLVQLFA